MASVNFILEFGIISHRTYKAALTGIDAEIGVFLGKWDFVQLFAAAGPYYYKGPCESAVGGKGSLQLFFNRYFSIEANVTGDKYFGLHFQGLFKITIPFVCTTHERGDLITQPVRRREIIVVQKRSVFEWNY